MSRRSEAKFIFPVVLLATLSASPLYALPACDTKIMAHITPQTVPVCAAAPSLDCSTGPFTTSANAIGSYFVYVLVSTGGELGGVKFGITYDNAPGSGVDVAGWVSCGVDLGLAASTTPAWPSSGSGNAIAWNPLSNCQTSANMAVAGLFYVNVYGADVLDLVGHPMDGQVSVTDCGTDPSGLLGWVTECVLPTSAAGAAGFGVPGEDPCPQKPDSDGDGAPDSIESAAQPGAELDDTIAAYQPGNSGYAIMEPASGVQQFSCVTSWNPGLGGYPGAMDPLPTTGMPPIADVDFPCGLVSFAVTSAGAGALTEIVITLPSGCPIPTAYWKYGRTPDDPTLHWYDFLGIDPVTGTGAVVMPGPPVEIHLNLYDGKRGDDDLLVNGIIYDIGAPGLLNPLSTPREPVIPGLVLAQNKPNPFGGRTTFAFELPEGGETRLRVFSVDGREVARPLQREFSPGPHEVSWDGRGNDGKALPAGVYFYKLETPFGSLARKMVVRP